MRVRRSWVRWLLPVVAVTLVAAGCSGGHDPATLPTASPSPTIVTPKPTPSATKTPKPTKSATQTKTPKPTKPPEGSLEQQLLATTKAFYSAITYGMKTLDVERIRAVSAPDCRACDRYITGILSTKSKREKYSPAGRYIIKAFALLPSGQGHDSFRNVKYTLHHTGATLRNSRGQVIQRIEPFTDVTIMRLYKDGEKWRVSAETYS